jgi:CHAD domain-containing protein
VDQLLEAIERRQRHAQRRLEQLARRRAAMSRTEPWVANETVRGEAVAIRNELARLRAVAKLDESPTDQELHQIRIKAKRLRYSAEAAAVAVGKPARRLAKAAANLQDVLGAHHDAVTAEGWLRESAANVEAKAGVFVAGELVKSNAASRNSYAKGGSFPGNHSTASRCGAGSGSSSLPSRCGRAPRTSG